MTRGIRTYQSTKPSEPLSLTDTEIDVLANILHQLGRIPDWKRRIDVAAQAVKIGIIEPNDPRHAAVCRACGITDKEGGEHQ